MYMYLSNKCIKGQCHIATKELHSYTHDNPYANVLSFSIEARPWTKFILLFVSRVSIKNKLSQVHITYPSPGEECKLKGVLQKIIKGDIIRMLCINMFIFFKTNYIRLLKSVLFYISVDYIN